MLVGKTWVQLNLVALSDNLHRPFQRLITCDNSAAAWADHVNTPSADPHPHDDGRPWPSQLPWGCPAQEMVCE
jgi:hypothetical protein